jgi:hypothetical protein
LNRGLIVLCFLLLAATACARGAAAQPGLLLGVDEDQFKWTKSPGQLQSALDGLGVGAVRITQTWQAAETKLSSGDAGTLARALDNIPNDTRVVLSVYGKPAAAPQTDDERDRYCGYVRSILSRFPRIKDLVVWNEVNSSMFWAPQYDANHQSVAPAAYEKLLAACYGPLHATRPGLNVITSLAPRGNDDPRFSNVAKHAPATFVRKLGAEYRASKRPVKLFDTFGQNVYPRSTGERPWRFHKQAPDVSQGDYARLIVALHEAFDRTGQPLPGQGDVTVWYLENGFQTTVDPAKADAYNGKENDRTILPPVSGIADSARRASAPDQATQLADAVELAYCQPGVGAFFNFMLADETDLGGWQSGVLWADGTRKPSFGALASVFHAAKAHSIDCGKLKGGKAGGVKS